jgi:hypothetical protein
MDFRSILNTRRVNGIMNGILMKASEKGVTIIEKRGVGDRGRFMAIPENNGVGRDGRRLESVAIINALRRGTVPESGLGRLAVGLATEEKVILSQLAFVGTGHADCKFVRGEYGSGKTFLISRAIEIALAAKFVTSHVVLSPDMPCTKTAGGVCENLRRPYDTDGDPCPQKYH